MATVAIAGLGVVGSAMRTYFIAQGIDTTIYDPGKNYSDDTVLKTAETVFICVPTPYLENGGFDDSAIRDVLSRIGTGATAVIKSPVIPGTTEKLQEVDPNLKLLCSPEFLTEKTALEDFSHPTRQIVGFTGQSESEAGRILKILPRAPYEKILPSGTAEMIKYMNNTFYALKVTYANALYDLCQKLGIDYDSVAEGTVSHEPMMGSNHWDVLYGGYRGYGGKCLPKDVRALIQLAETHGADARLLRLMEELNAENAKKAIIK